MKHPLPRSGDDTVAAKARLRREMRHKREAIPIELAQAAASAAAEHLLSSAPIAAAQVVAMYAAVRCELDPIPAAHALRSRGATLAYPRIAAGERQLTWHLIDEPQVLCLGSFGIPEPDAATPTIPANRIDCFVVPGLAFDWRGNRLGWGRGYYDATLASHPTTPRVGYGYECQRIEHVPVDMLDLPMNLIVTESNIWNPSF